ncbi:MAG: hypothetical protein WAV11_01780 [Minisyncoccia bacterium]
MKKARPTSNVTPTVTPQPVTPTGEVKKEKVCVWRYGLTYLLYMIMILFCLSIALSFLGPIFSLICYVGAGSPKPINQSSQTQAQSSEKIITVTGELSSTIAAKNSSGGVSWEIEPIDAEIWYYSDRDPKGRIYKSKEDILLDGKCKWYKFKKKQGENVTLQYWYR